jgi:chromosome segregation ATPase
MASYVGFRKWMPSDAADANKKVAYDANSGLITQLRDEIERLAKQNTSLADSLNKFQLQLLSFQTENQKLSFENNALREENLSLREEIMELRKEVQELSKTLVDMQRKSQ